MPSRFLAGFAFRVFVLATVAFAAAACVRPKVTISNGECFADANCPVGYYCGDELRCVPKEPRVFDDADETEIDRADTGDFDLEADAEPGDTDTDGDGEADEDAADGPDDETGDADDDDGADFAITAFSLLDPEPYTAGVPIRSTTEVRSTVGDPEFRFSIVDAADGAETVLSDWGAAGPAYAFVVPRAGPFALRVSARPAAAPLTRFDSRSLDVTVATGPADDGDDAETPDPDDDPSDPDAPPLRLLGVRADRAAPYYVAAAFNVVAVPNRACEVRWALSIDGAAPRLLVDWSPRAVLAFTPSQAGSYTFLAEIRESGDTGGAVDGGSLSLRVRAQPGNPDCLTACSRVDVCGAYGSTAGVGFSFGGCIEGCECRLPTGDIQCLQTGTCDELSGCGSNEPTQNRCPAGFTPDCRHACGRLALCNEFSPTGPADIDFPGCVSRCLGENWSPTLRACLTNSFACPAAPGCFFGDTEAEEGDASDTDADFDLDTEPADDTPDTFDERPAGCTDACAKIQSCGFLFPGSPVGGSLQECVNNCAGGGFSQAQLQCVLTTSCTNLLSCQNAGGDEDDNVEPIETDGADTDTTSSCTTACNKVQSCGFLFPGSPVGGSVQECVRNCTAGSFTSGQVACAIASDCGSLPNCLLSGGDEETSDLPDIPIDLDFGELELPDLPDFIDLDFDFNELPDFIDLDLNDLPDIVDLDFNELPDFETDFDFDLDVIDLPDLPDLPEFIDVADADDIVDVIDADVIDFPDFDVEIDIPADLDTDLDTDLDRDTADNDVIEPADEEPAACFIEQPRIEPTPSNTQVTLTGTTVGRSNTIAPSVAAQCPVRSAPGPDVVYAFTVTVGWTYRVQLTPESTYDAAVYIASQCTTATGCRGGADAGRAGTPETFTFRADQSGTFFLAVDSALAVGAAGASGAYRLSVTLESAPVDEDEAETEPVACSIERTLDLSVSDVTLTDTTANQPNQIDISSLADCGIRSAPGPDRVYALPIVLGNTYRVEVIPNDRSYDPALYIATQCNQATGCNAASDRGRAGQLERLELRAGITGTVLIAVDSALTAGTQGASGGYTLNVVWTNRPAADNDPIDFEPEPEPDTVVDVDAVPPSCFALCQRLQGCGLVGGGIFSLFQCSQTCDGGWTIFQRVCANETACDQVQAACGVP